MPERGEGRGRDGIETDNARQGRAGERERIEIKEMGVRETISPEQTDRQTADRHIHTQKAGRQNCRSKKGGKVMKAE